MPRTMQQGRAMQTKWLAGSCRVAIMQATPAQEARPIAAVIDAYPSASPDGRRVLFHSNRNGSNQVEALLLNQACGT
jgi:Tol biopolymer transport system component